VLLATALHAGRITVEDLRAIGAVPRRDGSA
jgi:hypothetical protein